MKYILDQAEYDRLKGTYLSYDVWLDGVIADIKYKAFAHQGQEQEKYLVKALQTLIKARGLLTND
jgi:hypothetical protein